MKPKLHSTTSLVLEAMLASPGGSYIFSGAPQVGKYTTALWLAQRLHCPEHDPTCIQCRQMAEGQHPSLLMVTPEDKASIGIDAIHQLQRQLTLLQAAQTTQLVIIDQAHLLTREAQNALLKTIEEPPPQTLILLLTQQSAALLPTIRSRCAVVHFPRLLPSDIQSFLEPHQLDDQKAKMIAYLSQGAVGLATQLSSDPELYERYLQANQQLTTVGSLSTFERLLLATKLSEGSGDPDLIPELSLKMIQQAIRQNPQEAGAQAAKLDAISLFVKHRNANVSLKSALSSLLLAL